MDGAARAGDNGQAMVSASPSPDPSTLRARPAAAGWRIVLSSLAVYVFGVVGSLVFGLLAILASFLPPRGAGMLLCARIWSRCLLAAAGARVEVSVDPALDLERDTGYVFLPNHQSYFDIPALLAVLPVPVRFAAKRSLFLIPIFGWSLRAGGFIPVDRKDRSRAREVFATAARRLEGGSSVLFFPEGTRTHDPRRMGSFQRGGFLVALKSGMPIVPVGIRGAADVLPRGTLVVRPGRIQVVLGAPIDVGAYGLRGKKQLIEETRRRIEALAGLAPDTGEGSPEG